MYKEKKEISVIIPVHNNSLTIVELQEELIKSLSKITDDYEIIYIDDRSHDNCWALINQFSKNSNKTYGLRMSKNFGQHKCILAGLHKARGNWIVVMDADLQDPPEYIFKLYEKSKEGFDFVVGLRKEYGTKYSKIIFSKIFYKTFQMITGKRFNINFGVFGIYSKKVIEAVKNGSKIEANFGIAILNLGFHRGEIEFLRESREQGYSSYTLSKRIKLASETLLANIERILNLLIIGSIVCSSLCIAFTIFLTIFHLFGKSFLPGWISIISLTLLLFSLLFLVISLMSVLTLKIYKYLDNPVSYTIDEETLKQS